MIRVLGYFIVGLVSLCIFTAAMVLLDAAFILLLQFLLWDSSLPVITWGWVRFDAVVGVIVTFFYLISDEAKTTVDGFVNGYNRQRNKND